MGNYLQTEFNKFHEAIKLHDKDDNQDLRDKRDMLEDELKTYFKKKAEKEGKARITFVLENQGSYSMGTGNKSIDVGDYDIDVMILFNIDANDYTPVEVKKWVFEALSRSNRTVEYMKPCVRVQYFKDGEELYHVDLALYANANEDEKTYISKGKPTSASEDKFWELSQPKELKKKINGKYNDEHDSKQFKRSIRYLKRWKDLKFRNTKSGKPTGIALTALAYNLFNPQIDRNPFDSSISPNDLESLKKLVSSIIGEFSIWNNKISVKLPVEPYNDLFEKMTNVQQETFKDKLDILEQALVDATNEPDPHEASKILQKVFGDDFPEVDKEKSGQKRALAFPGKSESA